MCDQDAAERLGVREDGLRPAWNTLYIATAGSATARPIAVATSASAIDAITACGAMVRRRLRRRVACLPRASNACTTPMTVPNRPMNGALLPACRERPAGVRASSAPAPTRPSSLRQPPAGRDPLPGARAYDRGLRAGRRLEELPAPSRSSSRNCRVSWKQAARDRPEREVEPATLEHDGDRDTLRKTSSHMTHPAPKSDMSPLQPLNEIHLEPPVPGPVPSDRTHHERRRIGRRGAPGPVEPWLVCSAIAQFRATRPKPLPGSLSTPGAPREPSGPTVTVMTTRA